MTKYSTSLRRIIQKRKKEVEDGRSEPFTALEIAKWSVSIAAGLEFLHKQRVVHRDMKPDNGTFGCFVILPFAPNVLDFVFSACNDGRTR